MIAAAKHVFVCNSSCRELILSVLETCKGHLYRQEDTPYMKDMDSGES